MAPHRADAATRVRFSRRPLMFIACTLACAFAMLGPARAETKNVRIMLDWIIQGTHAPFFIAKEKGYFTNAGVTVDAIDAGRGAGNVAVAVAGGAYHFGWGDLP